MILTFHQSSRNYTAILLKLLSNYKLEISTNDYYTIPVKFSSASRLYKSLNKNDHGSLRVPIMGLEINETPPDYSRSTNKFLKRKILEIDSENVRVTYNDTPVNYNFTLTLLSDSMTSLTNINEAIISEFHNGVRYVDYTSPLGEIISTPIKLESISLDTDNNESDFIEDRLIQSTFTFVIEGVVHQQLNYDEKYIKEINLYLQKGVDEVEYELDSYTID